MVGYSPISSDRCNNEILCKHNVHTNDEMVIIIGIIVIYIKLIITFILVIPSCTLLLPRMCMRKQGVM